MDSIQLSFDGFCIEESLPSLAPFGEPVGKHDLVIGILPRNLRYSYLHISVMNPSGDKNAVVTDFNISVRRAFPDFSIVVYDIRRNWEVVIAKPHHLR